MNAVPTASSFPQVRAAPYLWPFDAVWTAADSALLLVDPLLPSAVLPAAVEACHAVGITVIVARPLKARLAFEPRPEDLVVERVGDSAFHATDLLHVLRSRVIYNLVLAGYPTEGPVHGTMREANDHGFECLLLADACSSTDRRFHEAVLRATCAEGGRFGCITTVAAFLEALGG